MQRLVRPLLLAIALLLAATAHADVPGRVGRIATMQGDVQFYSENDPEWKLAFVNQPITSRNSIFVGDSGRAEISVGSTTMALEAGSQVDFDELDDDTLNANVVRGRVSMRIRQFEPTDRYNVAVPGAEFELLQPGRYRIDANADGSGVTVFAGRATAQTDNGALTVAAGNALRAVQDPRDPDGPAAFRTVAATSTALDDWVLAREGRFREGQASRYVSPYMTGYEELDANGRWTTEAEVGPVWYPTTHVQADWAPYRYGRWAFVAPWGYTWIDDAPWGFAPFHYGRWVQLGGRWGWCPGAYVARPVYAPALVGFYGGSGISVSVGSGPSVGWYPLAPWQRYSPHYTRNARHLNHVNNIAIVNPPARLARGYEGRGGRGSRDPQFWNRDFGGTIAPQDAFASQRSISRVARPAPRQFLDGAAPVDVTALPRPAAVTAALRGGPSFNQRPEFRSPRDFASRPFDRADRPGDGDRRGRGSASIATPPRGQDLPVGAPMQQRPPDRERGVLPPNYRRMQEENRTVVVPQGSAPGSAALERRREQPPQVQAPMVAPMRSDGDGAIETPRPRDQRPDASRIVEQPGFQPGQPQPRFQRPEAARIVEQPGFQPQQRFERPNREMRNIQQQPQMNAPIADRPQRMERPQIERPQPAAVQQAPAALAPRPQAPMPAPQAAPAQPQPQPTRPELARPREMEQRGGMIRER